ncbi:MAG: sulfurtransferase TusA family protein [Chloroflexi bacterium]|nr:sulfurtransferase TusA family protein [Chloroflexota bacterium]
MTQAAVKTVDSRGEFCPVPVVKLSLALEEVQPGQVVELIATDPGSKADVPAWAEMTGHVLLRTEDRDKAFIYFIQKV